MAKRIDNQENSLSRLIVDNIKKAAKEKGMNMTELALSVEMTQTGFYKMLEKGSFRVVTLKKIADTLGVTCAELLGENIHTSEGRALKLMKELFKEIGGKDQK